MKKTILSIVCAVFVGSAAQAHLINETQIAQGGNSNPATEIALLEAWMPSLGPLTYLAKYEYGNDNDWADDGLFGAANFSASLVNPGPPATADIMWNLTGTGYILKAVLVKTSNDFLRVYTVTPDQYLQDLTGPTVTAPDMVTGNGTQKLGEDISHISFFGMPGDGIPVPDSGTTLALLGAALALFAIVRRQTN